MKMKGKDETRITAVEIKFMRTPKYTWSIKEMEHEKG
jgi:hypothetical protein